MARAHARSFGLVLTIQMLFVIGTLFVAGCGGSSTDASLVVAVTITPAPVMIAVGADLGLNATATDAQDNPVTGIS